MRLDPAWLDELRRRAPLAAVVGKHVKLAWTGGEAVGLCPFHGERTPSFNVVPAKGFFHCFGCGAHGDAIGFVMEAEGVDFLAAVALLAGLAGLPLPAGFDAAAASYPHPNPPPLAGEGARGALRPAIELAAEAAVKREEALAIWLAARRLEPGDPVWRYLAGRAIDLARLTRLPGALRFHPRLWHQRLARHFPAMVAAIRDDGGDGGGGHLSTHCTYLAVTAERVTKIRAADPSLARRCYGSYRGGSIKLARGQSGKAWRQAPQGDRLVMGEGIEDTLTASLALPDYRAAAGVAGGNFRNLVLPAAIEEVILVTQNDRLKAGRRPGEPDWWARAEAHFLAQGRRVRLLTPPVFCKDLSDWAQWLAARAAEPQENHGDTQDTETAPRRAASVFSVSPW